MDIWVDATPNNGKRTYQALVEFGAPLADLTVHDLAQQQTVFQFGVAPVRVAVMTSIDGVISGDAWEHREQINLDVIPISVISLEHLKNNKKASNRHSDKTHLALLDRYAKKHA